MLILTTSSRVTRSSRGRCLQQNPSAAQRLGQLFGVEETRSAPPSHSRLCDGFRMPAPLAEFATRTVAGGPAFESRQGRKPREMGTPIGGRYGDFAGAVGAAQVLERGVSGNGCGGGAQRGDVEG